MNRALRDRAAGVIGSLELETTLLSDQHLIHRLDRERVLEGHSGCVNTLSFSPSGETLISGSDDRHVIFWDWPWGVKRHRFYTGHQNNIFQARVLPQSGDKTLLTCAADGQVRVAQIREGAACLESKVLFRHGGRAHRLALEPEEPTCFYSCGEDGQVCHYDLRQNTPYRPHLKLLVCRNRSRAQVRPLDLNTIDVNPVRPWQFAVAGGEEWVRIYDKRRPDSRTSHAMVRGRELALAEPVAMLCPMKLRRTRPEYTDLSITCAKYSCTGEILASYSDETCMMYGEGKLSSRIRCAMSDPVLGQRSTQEGLCGFYQVHTEQSLAQDIYLFSSDGSMGSTSSRREGGPTSPTLGSAPKRARATSPSRHGARRPGRGSADMVPASVDRTPPAPTGASTQLRTNEAGQAVALAAAPSSGTSMASQDGGDGQGAAHVPRQISASAGSRGHTGRDALPASSSGADPDMVDSLRDDGAPPAHGASRPALSRIVRGEDRLGGRAAAGSAPMASIPADPSDGPNSGRGIDEAAASAEDEDEAGEGAREIFENSLADGVSRVQFRRAPPDSAVGNEVTFRLSVEDLMNAVHAVSNARRRRDVNLAHAITDEGGRVGVAGVSRGSQRSSARPRPRDEGDAEAEETDEPPTPREDHVLRRFSGDDSQMSVWQNVKPCHRNRRTVKGVNFMGSGDSYVVSGSDCGHIYIWNKATGRLEQWLKGDDETVNCLEPHPYTMVLATSGLEHTVKVWSPKAAAPRIPGEAADAVMQENAAAREDDSNEPDFSFTRFIHQLQRSAAPGARRTTQEARRRRSRGGRVDEAEQEVDEDDDDGYDSDGDGVDPRDGCSIS